MDQVKVTLPQVFFTYYASKNQQPAFSVMGTLAGNGLRINQVKFVEDSQSYIWSVMFCFKQVIPL